MRRKQRGIARFVSFCIRIRMEMLDCDGKGENDVTASRADRHNRACFCPFSVGSGASKGVTTARTSVHVPHDLRVFVRSGPAQELAQAQTASPPADRYPAGG